MTKHSVSQCLHIAILAFLTCVTICAALHPHPPSHSSSRPKAAFLELINRNDDEIVAASCKTPEIILKRFSSPLTPTRQAPVSMPSATVSVPTGWKVISGGVFVSYSGKIGQHLTKSMPVIEGSGEAQRITGWSVQSSDLFASDRARISAIAVAIYDPNDAWQVVATVSDDSKRSPQALQRAGVPPGYVLTGGGAQVMPGGDGGGMEVGGALISNYPSTRTTWTAQGSSSSSGGGGVVVRAYALGLRARSGATLATTRITLETAARAGLRDVDKLDGRPTLSDFSIAGCGARTKEGVARPLVFLTSLVPNRRGKYFRATAKVAAGGRAAVVRQFCIEIYGAVYRT